MKKIYPRIILSLAISLITFLQVLLVNQQSMAQADAGISAFTQPATLICHGSNDVSAVVHNYGVDTLTSVTINWSVNGVAQTAVVLGDTIPTGVDDTITLGTYIFTAATTYTIDAVTSLPNGGIDADNSNDSATVGGIKAQLSGTYTVGGTAPDFARFPDAVAALNNYGVCGPVAINIRPMFDTIKVAINQINGASATNIIVIQAENGDSTSVILSQASSGFGANDYLIRLNGADYVTLCKLTLQRTGTQNLQHVIDFTNGATNNTVIYNQILGGTPFGISTQGALIYSSSMAATNDSSNTISNNRMIGGSYGIYLNGQSAVSLEAFNTIKDNIILNQTARGIHLNFQRSPVIENNRITSNTTNAGYSGIYLLRDQGDIYVAKNTILTSHGFAFYSNNCSSGASNPGLVLNNFFAAGDSAGIRILSGTFQDFLNNSVLMKDSSMTALYISGTGSGNIIQNNILVNESGGYCYVSNSFATSGILLSNNNDFYTTGTDVGRYGATITALLSDWVTATGQDNNSVSMDPQFVSSTDLHVTSSPMDNLGQSLGYVTDDIDGEVRDLSTPDIGADEYTGGTHDLSVIALVNPTDSICEDAALQVSVVISNLGTAPAGGFNVYTNVSGTVTDAFTQTFSGVIQPGETDTLTYSATLNATGGGVLNFQSYTGYVYDEDHSNDTLTAQLFINPLPTLNIPLNQPGVCAEGSVVLTAASSDTIKWYDAPVGGNLVGTGPTFTTPYITTPTIYYVSATGVCITGLFPVLANVYSLPTVNLGNDTIAMDSVTLDAGAGIYSYLWSTLDTTQQIIAHASGSYSVTVTDTNGCTNADTIVVTIIVGIPDYAVADNILVYPNPAVDRLNIMIAGSHSDVLNIRIVDMLGAILRNEAVKANGNQQLSLQYPVSDLAKGVYFLQVTSEKGNWNFKFNVQ